MRLELLDLGLCWGTVEALHREIKVGWILIVERAERSNGTGGLESIFDE